MNLVRKGVVHLLSLVLFLSLLAGAVATSITMAFSHPAKLENWLAQSSIYSSFVDDAVKQANKSANGGGQSGGVSLNDVAVQQAAQSAFSPSLLQQDVNTVLNSNYDWLEGKTATPEFKIDLTSAKTSFAQQVGLYVQAHLASLPVCTTAQLATAQQELNNDPLSLTCRPAPLNPGTEAANITQQLSTNGSFLSNPVITASSINPNKSVGSQPYYQKFSFAPKLYRLAVSTPLILGALALLSAVGMFFIAPVRRRGLRRIAWVLLEVGIILAAMKYAVNFGFTKVEDQIFNKSSAGPLQQSLTNFAHKVATQLTATDLYFGITFVVLAVVIFVFLIVTRPQLPKLGKKSKAIAGNQSDTPPVSLPTPVIPETTPKAQAQPKPKKTPLIQ